MLKKTKIICTQGPATDPDGIVDALIESGMNCARFNFSHGTHAEHLVRISKVREAAERAGKVISLILDTKGPEMRLGEFTEGKVQLEKGKQFTLTYDDAPGDETHVSVNHKQLYSEVKPGDTLLLSDGLVGLVVDEIRGKDIVTTIQNSGPMSTRKRVAAPGIELSLPAISEQDERDIIFGIQNDMDFVAASFIQRPSDVEEIRHLIAKHGGHMEIIPKIENLAGVNNFDAILAVSDGIMVARGDLGVEVPAEDVPVIQKEIIRKCNAVGKPVIVATQMLESMTTNPRPTRAEVSDVANAVLDGTDAVMLSAESAAGAYPFETVRTMAQICAAAEQAQVDLPFEHTFDEIPVERIDQGIANSAVFTALLLHAKAIVALTESGTTAFQISRFGINLPIHALTPSLAVQRKMSIYRSVRPARLDTSKEHDEAIREAEEYLVQRRHLKSGDLYVITSGSMRSSGGTDELQVRRTR